MKRRIRGIAALLAALLLLAVLTSALVLITHAQHDCAGEDCPICAILSGCLRALRELFACVLAATLTLLAALRTPASFACVPARAVPRTPVSLRVKLSN